MEKIAITGAGGFLGMHVRAAALEYGIEVVGIALGEGFDLDQTVRSLRGVNRVIHLAGVNRGDDHAVSDGNLLFATQLASGLERCESMPDRLVFANSIQAGNGTIYGKAKLAVDAELQDLTSRLGMNYENVRLPNIFGEYGKPHYNSVIATFSHLISRGQTPHVNQDTELTLLHAQDAADFLLGCGGEEGLQDLSHVNSVSGVKRLLLEFHELYSVGEIPDISTTFRRNLFNTYRAYAFPENMPLAISRNADHRGSFFEIVRSRGGTGQTSFSTTQPGVTRGDHFHRRKVERFTVLSGAAEIKLRRVFDDRVFTYAINGHEPASVDMPTLYSHSIRNVGNDSLYTAFWTNDIFDPSNPDTISEEV